MQPRDEVNDRGVTDRVQWWTLLADFGEEMGTNHNDKKDEDHTVNTNNSKVFAITIRVSHTPCNCVCYVCIWLAVL